MLEAHDLVNPSFNYEPRFNKPVLSYWMVAGLSRTFGVSVAVQRFGIALGAMVIIACAYVLARSSLTPIRLEPRFEIGIPALESDAGLWAAAGLAASPRLVMFARRIFIDVWITAFLSLTLAFFALSERYPARRRRFLILMYVSIGLGVLTKGPVAVALPALSFALYLGLRGELRRIRELMIPAGVLIVAAIVVPWYTALYHQHGLTYIRSFLVAENIERFTSGVGVRQERGPWFYLPVVFSDSFPWSMLLPAAFAVGVEVARPPARPAVVLDRRDRRLLLVLRGQAGSLYVPDCRRGRGAGRPRGRSRSVGSALGPVGLDDDGDWPGCCWRSRAARCWGSSKRPAACMRSTPRGSSGRSVWRAVWRRLALPSGADRLRRRSRCWRR